MGGTASTRRISVKNEDTSGVIKISDSVVSRIRNELQNQPQDEPQRSAREPPKPSSVPPPRPPPPPPAPPAAPAPPPPQPQPPAVERRAAAAASAPPPAGRYSEEAYISLLKLRDEKDAELRRMEQSWREKINEMERRHAEQQGLTTEAFHRTLAEVQGLFLKASTTPICQDGQERVMNCYAENPKQSLKCSREVQQFSECVDLTRLNRLMR